MKTFIAFICYAVAMFLIYAGLNLAPDMTWPKTDIEYVACFFIVIGLSHKLLGHVLLFSASRAYNR